MMFLRFRVSACFYWQKALKLQEEFHIFKINEVSACPGGLCLPMVVLLTVFLDWNQFFFFFLLDKQDRAVHSRSATRRGRASPDQSAGPPWACGPPAPPPLQPARFCCFARWTHCPLRKKTKKVINHNYLFCWQSPSHSCAHSFSPSSLSLALSL